MGKRAAKLGLDVDDLQAIQEYTEALKNRRHGMSSINDEDTMNVIKMHEGSLVVQRDLEEKVKENQELHSMLSAEKTKNEEMLDENDKLRAGMHEILDSIKEQDGESDVMVSSPILEKLLAILDSRHLYGEYKPMMGLKMQMEKLEGVNAQLREQLRYSRQDDDKLKSQLQKVRYKLHQSESELEEVKKGSMYDQTHQNIHQVVNVAERSQNSSNVNTEIDSSSETVAILETQLIQVLDEYDNKTTIFEKLQKDNEVATKMLSVVKHQLGLVYEDFGQQSSNWKKEKNGLEEKNKEMEEKLQSIMTKNKEYEDFIESLKSDEVSIKGRAAEATRKVAVLKSNESLILRKFKHLEQRESLLSKENQQLQNSLVELECKAIKSMGAIMRFNDKYVFKLNSLQTALEKSVPMSALEEANRQYNEITAKYRDLIEKQQKKSMN